MEFSNQQEDSSKSSSEEIDRSSEQNDDMGTGRSYECVFCKRGFTTAQALGGHMNIHRKDRANNKTKLPNFPPSSSSKVDENYSDLGFYSSINPSHVARVGGYYSSAAAALDHHHHQHREVDDSLNNNYHQIYFPRPSHSEVLCLENQRVDREFLFGQDWRQRGLSLYTNPLCVHGNKDKIENSSEVEDDLDLELRLGHYRP